MVVFCNYKLIDMNLYLRLLLTLLRSLFLPSLKPGDTLVIRRRVWPNDLDINLHMNNGRYFTMTDLSLLEYFARTGMLKACWRNNWRPMSGAGTATFRRGLSLFQRYELHFRWYCTDGKWNYITYEFVSKGRICASGVLKGGVVGKTGLIDIRESMPYLPDAWRAYFEQILSRPVAPEIAGLSNAESGLYAQSLVNLDATLNQQQVKHPTTDHV